MSVLRPEPYEVLIERLKTARADRRAVIRVETGAAVGIAAVATGAGLTLAQHTSTPAATASPDVCGLTPELTEGPYFVNGDLVRTDITQDRSGVPLSLKINVVDPDSFTAIENAAVDIWHCDALGYYSGVAGNQPCLWSPLGRLTWMRPADYACSAIAEVAQW